MTARHFFDFASTPLGAVWFEVDDRAVVRLWFADRPPRSVTNHPRPEPTPTPLGERLKRQLRDYFAHQRQGFSVPVAPQGTPFQQAVWRSLLTIPCGVTISYSQQAEALGRRSAVRAVANANGANPLPVLIPCHRVVAKNGGLGGYGPGLDKKAWLIEHEQQHI